MTLYIDSLFMVNFIMNYTILFLTGKLVNSRFGKSIRKKQYAIGSFIVTSTYLVIICVKMLRNNFNIFFAVLLISLGIYIVFKPTNFKMFLTYLLFTHLVAFTIGGISFGVFYYTKAGAYLGNMVVASSKNMSLKLLIATTSCTYIIVKIVAKYIENLKLSKQKLINVEVTGLNGVTQEIVMLVDTGNTLLEPISKLPVIVIPYFKIEKLLDEEIYKLYEKEKDIVTQVFNSNSDYINKLKIVPFKSVGKENGLLLGFETYICFEDNGLSITKKCIIGIINIEVSSWEYSGIFNPLLFEEELTSVTKIMA